MRAAWATTSDRRTTLYGINCAISALCPSSFSQRQRGCTKPIVPFTSTGDPAAISAASVLRALSRELELAVRNLEVPVFCSRRGGGPPGLESFVSEDAERVTGGEMALDVEG